MTNPRQELLADLEETHGGRAMLIAASSREDLATDLDASAARAFIEVFDRLDTPEQLTLVFDARGGRAEFADAVTRVLRASGTRLHLIVPTTSNGVASLLALSADELTIHDYAGLGAYDVGPMRLDAERLDHRLFDDIPALGGIDYAHDPKLPVRLAAGLRERRLCRELARRLASEDVAYDRLSVEHLGDRLALGASELADAGFPAGGTDEELVWKFTLTVEETLGSLEAPPPRYTESDLGDEVEFEPAVGLTVALVESAEHSLTRVLDTGRPHPETGEYQGHWTW
jgi:hypothetical protein